MVSGWFKLQDGFNVCEATNKYVVNLLQEKSLLIALLVQTPVLELVLSDCVGTRMSTSPRTSTNTQLRNRTKTSVRTITKY